MALLLHRNLKAASEIRLRVAKWGATPENRARLHLQLVPDDETKPKLAVVKPIDAKSRWAALEAA